MKNYIYWLSKTIANIRIQRGLTTALDNAQFLAAEDGSMDGANAAMAHAWDVISSPQAGIGHQGLALRAYRTAARTFFDGECEVAAEVGNAQLAREWQAMTIIVDLSKEAV